MYVHPKICITNSHSLYKKLWASDKNKSYQYLLLNKYFQNYYDHLTTCISLPLHWWRYIHIFFFLGGG